jgi:hypothetical protein
VPCRNLILHVKFSLGLFQTTSYCKPADAFRKQLEIDRAPKHTEGLQTLSARVQPEDVLKAALTHDDTRLLRVAGEMCANTPRLLAQVDIKNEKWRAIWLYRLESGGEVWAGIPDPVKIVRSLMDFLLLDEKIEPSILMRIAATQHGDLTGYPGRSEIWNKMEPQVADAFLNITAESWINQFKLNPDFDRRIESRLEDAVLDERRLLKHFTYGRADTLSFGISLFRRFSRLGELQFSGWLGRILDTGAIIEPVSATLIGKLVSERRWKNLAHQLYRYFNSRNRTDLIPALSECYSLLGWLQRFLLHGKLSYSITEDEWWGALQDLATELYPKGPEAQYVWSRSGGDPSLIDMGQSGRSQWISALQTLRKGGGGKQISIESLLSEMKVDYPSSEGLKVLDQIRQKK